MTVIAISCVCEGANPECPLCDGTGMEIPPKYPTPNQVRGRRIGAITRNLGIKSAYPRERTMPIMGPAKPRVIVTRHDPKPIPDRRFDWQATFKDYDLGDPVGHGSTEAAALADFRIEAEMRGMEIPDA